MKIIETHCHLDYLKNESLQEILSKSLEVGIEKIITISVEPENFDTVLSLAENHDQIYFTQGIHPHDAKKSTTEALKVIEQRCVHPKMVAVGEIGLDYYYNHSPRETQLKVLEHQFEIAIAQNKPVVIHSRDADDDMIMMLEKFAPRLKRKGVIHSFTSGQKLADTALAQGFYIGFNGILTFKNAQNVRDVFSSVPLEKMLLETDAPFLTPIPHRGKENAPYYLPFILSKISELKGQNEQEVSEILYKNSINLFFS
jgi:TatD DNase family protein